MSSYIFYKGSEASKTYWPEYRSSAVGGVMVTTDWLRSLSGHYPSADNFSDRSELSNDESRLFASIWLTEGIPYAFHDVPVAYHAAREEVARLLSIQFRDLGVTGSGRIGYSMNPKNFGRDYNASTSDIDLFVVNNKLFDRITVDARSFISDFSESKIQARSEREHGFWAKNAGLLAKKVEEGFVDAQKIPTLDRYIVSQKVNDAAFRFKVIGNYAAKREIINKASIRVYSNWNSATKQIAFNLRNSIKYKNLSGGEAGSEHTVPEV